MQKTLYLALVVFVLGLLINVSGAQSPSDEIMQQLRLDAGGKTEVVKSFSASFPGVLTARGEPTVYTRQNSNDALKLGADQILQIKIGE